MVWENIACTGGFNHKLLWIIATTKYNENSLFGAIERHNKSSTIKMA